MIVSLHFGSYSETLVEFDDSCVVLKHADTPWRLDLFGGFGNVGFEEAVDFFAVELDFTLERFVAAMFTPCLTNCLQFDVSGVAFFLLKISLNFLSSCRLNPRQVHC